MSHQRWAPSLQGGLPPPTPRSCALMEQLGATTWRTRCGTDPHTPRSQTPGKDREHGQGGERSWTFPVWVPPIPWTAAGPPSARTSCSLLGDTHRSAHVPSLCLTLGALDAALVLPLPSWAEQARVPHAAVTELGPPMARSCQAPLLCSAPAGARASRGPCEIAHALCLQCPLTYIG